MMLQYKGALRALILIMLTLSCFKFTSSAQSTLSSETDISKVKIDDLSDAQLQGYPYFLVNDGASHD